MRNLVKTAITTVIFFSILFLSCKRDELPVTPTETEDFSELQTRITSSVSGFVTDHAGVAVAGASVKAGAKTTTTNSFGYFEIKDAEQPKNASFVTIEKTGFFKGIKSWIGNAAQPAFFRIKLLQKASAGTISGSAGGSVTTTDNLQISFPADAVALSSSGAAYTGTVTVHAKWIDPSSPELTMIMPGDLRGQNSENNIQLLTTYGMAAVELKGAAGEDLQIAPGKKATMTFPIPTTLTGTAPATIPLWSFNESNGLWKQEGSASKSGSNYVGEVSHFSFWNCDVPANFTTVQITVNDAGGNPVQSLVRLTRPDGSWLEAFTNTNGVVSGPVPVNESLNMTVKANTTCAVVLHSQTITGTPGIPLEVTATLQTNRTARISGTITDCATAPITNGGAYFYSNTAFGYYAVVNNVGQYNISIPLCSAITENYSAEGYNFQNGTVSNTSTFIVTGGAQTTQNFQTCTTNPIAKFFNIAFSSWSAGYTAPPDTVRIISNNPGGSNIMRLIRGGRIGPVFTLLYISTPSGTVTPGQTYSVSSIATNEPGGISAISSQGLNAFVLITEAGPVNTGYTAGTISGTFTPSSGPTQNISGSFRAGTE